MRNNDAKQVFLMMREYPILRTWLFHGKNHNPEEIDGFQKELNDLREEFHK